MATFIFSILSAVGLVAFTPQALADVKLGQQVTAVTPEAWVQSLGPSPARAIVLATQVTQYFETIRFFLENADALRRQGFDQLVFEYFPTQMIQLFTTLKEVSRERKLQFIRGQLGTFYLNLNRALVGRHLSQEQVQLYAEAILRAIEKARSLKMFVRFLNTDASADPCLGVLGLRPRDDYQRMGKAVHEYKNFMKQFELTNRAFIFGYPNNLIQRGRIPNNLVGQLTKAFPGQIETVEIQVLHSQLQLQSENARIFRASSAAVNGQNFVRYPHATGYQNATLFLPESPSSPLR